MGFFISRNIRGPRDSSRNIDEPFQHIPTMVQGMVHGMVDDWVCLRMGETSVLLPDYLGINMNKMSFASIDPAK